jgi:Leucine-rich repeat (LRR) protein
LDQLDTILARYLAGYPVSGLTDIRKCNLVSGRIPDIKKAGLSGRTIGASLNNMLHFFSGNLTKLTNLNLDRNRLEFLPTEMGNLVQLGVLSLRENRLVELPSEIGNCRELHVLDVCGNRLQHLPFSLTSLNLKVSRLLANCREHALDMGGNRLQ